MNIHELEKLATPGPLKLSTLIAAPQYNTAVYAWINSPDSNGYGGVKSSVAAVYTERGPADAALLVHCRNKFMKALEALKEVNDPDMTSHEWKHWLAALPALIKELETVV
jgi:hypothetical protein